MKKYVILVFILLTATVNLFAQYGYSLNLFEPEIIDARAEALGKTSIMSSAGANNLFNNPAMLGNLESKNIQISGRALFGTPKRTHKAEDTDDNEVDVTEYEFEYPFHTKLNGLSVGFPVSMGSSKNIKLGFSAGYRTYYDWGFDVNTKRTEEYDGEVEIDKDEKEFNGGFNTVVLGSGLTYKNNFLFGASVSLPFLSEVTSKTESTFPTRDRTLKGTFFTFSGCYIINDVVRVAAKVRTGYNLEMDVESSGKFDYTIPAEYGVGLEVKPIDKLKCYMEYTTRNLSEYEGDIINNDSDNGYAIKTGIEFGSKILYRAGFYMQSVPMYEITSYYDEELDDMVLELNDTPQIDKGITAGLGVNVNSYITINIFGAYSFLKYDESYNFVEYVDISNELTFSMTKIGCSLGCNF